jgi:predicted nucleotidyltransferase
LKKIEKIKAEIRKHMQFIEENYKVKTLEIFGSYIRGAQKKKSDLDILVEFYETSDLFTFIELELFLTEMIGIQVDLVMEDTLKPRIKDRILREAVPVLKGIMTLS